MAQGAASTLAVTGRVQNHELRIEVGAGGKMAAASIPWSDDYGGLFAEDESLAARPLQPGEKRTLRAFVPNVNQLGTMKLTARQYEQVQWPPSVGSRPRAAEEPLLRIDEEITLADGQKLAATVWADRSGEILARRQQAMDLRWFRVPKEVALAETGQAPFDLVLGLSVNLDRRLPGAHLTRRVRYRMHLPEGNPAKVFPSGPSQEVKRLDPHTAEVTVYALRPDWPAPLLAAADPPGPERSPAEQPDPERERKDRGGRPAGCTRRKGPLAAGDRAGEEGAQPDHQVGLRTGVCLGGRGDSFGRGRLQGALHALGRAGPRRGIPARVVAGLVYTEQSGVPSLAYHMWNELYLGNRWIPLDATLGQGGIGAAHVKLAHTDLAGVSAFSSFLSVAQVAGQLRVEVLEVE